MKRVFLALALCLVTALCGALTLQWDAGADWPAGTTVEACVNAECVSGITATEQLFSTHPPGTVLDARARAVAPDGRMSDWAAIAQTLPADQQSPGRAVWYEGSVANMAAPTYVNQYATAFNTATSPKTAMNAVAINSGDVIVGLVIAESGFVSGPPDVYGTPSFTENGAGSWTQRQISPTVNNDWVSARASTYVASTNENLTATLTSAGATTYFGGNLVLFSGSDGVGASNIATGVSGNPSVSLTTTQDNSAIVVMCGDWNATSGTQTFTNNFSGTPTALTDFPGDAAHYGVAVAYFPDAGAAGSKTIGMSAPTGQKWTIIAIEVKGTAGGATTSIPPDILNPTRYASLLAR